jgi:hypothetical protein
MKRAPLFLGSLILLGAAGVLPVGCNAPESGEPEPLAAPAALAATVDPVVSCVSGCQATGKNSDGTPSNDRLNCCRGCLDGIPYETGVSPFDHAPWVCSTETHEYLRCLGLNPPIENRCNDTNTQQCPAGYDDVIVAPGAGNHFQTGTWCTNVTGTGDPAKTHGHTWYFVFNQCADGSHVYPPGSCADGSQGTAYCETSGGHRSAPHQSHITRCSAIDPDPTICCTPSPATWKASPSVAVAAVETTAAAGASCGCSEPDEVSTLDPTPVPVPTATTATP